MFSFKRKEYFLTLIVKTALESDESAVIDTLKSAFAAEFTSREQQGVTPHAAHMSVPKTLNI